jgi:Na+/H+ antiporter NhaA
MDTVKKYMGWVWMLLAPSLIGFMGWQAGEKITQATVTARSNIALQWGIILGIFVPVCIGFFIFGYYAAKGYYNRLPQHSGDLRQRKGI